jgi:hypothetical protein
MPGTFSKWLAPLVGDMCHIYKDAWHLFFSVMGYIYKDAWHLWLVKRNTFLKWLAPSKSDP